MIPSAGLFLPETLHRIERPTSNHMESDRTRLRYFQRRSGLPKTEAREVGTSLASSSDILPTETVDIFSSITTAFHFADFVFTSSKASSESHALACLIDRVRKDVSEASRLYLSPRISNFLEAWPDKKIWIDAILTDVHQSLNEIGSYMETFRVAGDDGGAVGLKRRFEWIAGHQKRLINKQQLLSTCHQSLVTAINTMQTVELCGVTNRVWEDPIFEAPVQPWIRSDETLALKGPYSRRDFKASQKNLSLSSMYLPRPDEDDVETRSINCIPAELHGSTPDDIAGPEGDPSTSSSLRNSSKRASFRRSYFAKAFEGPTLYTPPFASPVPELDNLQIQPSNDQILERSSADQSLPTSLTSHNTRHSLDNTRSHSHPEQSQNHARPAPRPRPSSDFGQVLPSVAEKTIERNDSTMSTTAVVSVPQVAKRYYANPVYIRRHSGRHASMPSVLPHVRSQSSLTEDLAAWMTTVHSERLESVEWHTSSVVSSPSMSVMSFPSATTVLHYTEPLKNDTGGLEDGGVPVTVTEQRPGTDTITRNGRAFSQDTIPVSLRAPSEEAINVRSRTASIHSTSSSSISRKPLPTTVTPSWIHLTPPPPTIDQQPPRIVDTTVYTPYRPPPAVAQDTELSLLQQHMLRQTHVPAIEMPASPSSQVDVAPVAELSCHNTIRRKKTAEVPNPTSSSAAESVTELSRHDTVRRKEEIEASISMPASTIAQPAVELSCHNTVRRKDKVESPKPTPAVESIAELSCHNTMRRKEKVESPEPMVAQPAAELIAILPHVPQVDMNVAELPSSEPISAATSVSDLCHCDSRAREDVPKPMSAQAKRRAAHRRRMELDFGGKV